MPVDKHKNTSETGRKSPGVVNLILVLGSAGATLYFVVSLLSIPFASVRVGILVPLLIVSGLFINRALAILMGYFPSRKSRTSGILTSIARRLLTVAIPLIFVSYINGVVNEKEVRKVRDHFAPLIANIEEYVKQHGRTPMDIADLLPEEDTSIPFIYFHGEGRYMLEIRGGSIDIDGSTIFFSPSTNQWVRIHNDLLNPDSESEYSKDYYELREGLEAVPYRDGSG